MYNKTYFFLCSSNLLVVCSFGFFGSGFLFGFFVQFWFFFFKEETCLKYISVNSLPQGRRKYFNSLKKNAESSAKD